MLRTLCRHTTRSARLRCIQIPANSRRRDIHNFSVIEHTVSCAHSRHRPAGAELGHENELRLHVKQYVPNNNPKPKPGDLTIIGAQANGFPKEMLEPLWDDLVQSLKSKGRRLRSVWVADMACQGQSGVFNEKILGPDPSWYDHSRDLLHFVNTHQAEIPHPIIGVGASVGASQLVHLALLHPRLLHSVVLIDPVLQLENPSKAFAPGGTYRRDIWPTLEAASESFAKSPFYQSWDPRILERWTKYGLRQLPTEKYPSSSSSPYSDSSDSDSPSSRRKKSKPDPNPPVTLSTTKAQETYLYVRPSYTDPRLLQRLERGHMHHEMHYNDIDVSSAFPFYRPEPASLFRKLPELSPNAHFIVGSHSPLAKPAVRKARLDMTGTGVGGSGGKARAGASETVIDCGHLVAFEKTEACAEAAAEFIDVEMFRYDAEEQDRRLKWNRLSRRDRVDFNEAWLDNMPEPERRKKGSGNVPGEETKQEEEA